jgi:predicted GIY-YIG superfamily endonuclease
LVIAFENLNIGQLSEQEIKSLERTQGVYQLFHKDALVYVGQAQSLKKRLTEHHEKIAGRKNISVAEMGFKCLYVHPNWTALAPEDALIKYHRKLGKGSCPWNGNGFGPHDPGRERETTNKPTEGFDVTYPIREDWECSWVKAGDYKAHELLKSLKGGLPYLLRFEMEAPKSQKPHPDLAGAGVRVPRSGMRADELLKLIAARLTGWQATAFPGHLILYKERRDYHHGKTIWPSPAPFL